MPLSQYSAAFNNLIDSSRLHKVTRGESIVDTDSMQGVFAVKTGFVKRYLIKNDGSIGVQGVYGPGDCFGITVLARLLVKGNSYNGSEVYYYEALSDATVCEISSETLQAALPSHPELYKDFFTIQGRHSLSNIYRLENQSIGLADRRVAHIICFYIDRYGEKLSRGWQFKVPFIQQDLADILDLSRETVSISINELKRLKLLGGRRKIIIPDIEALRQFSYQS